MMVTTTDAKRFKVTEEDTFVFIGKKNINKGCWRWILIALVFYPALLAYFFVGESVYVISIDGCEYTVNDYQYKRLVDFFDGE